MIKYGLREKLKLIIIIIIFCNISTQILEIDFEKKSLNNFTNNEIVNNFYNITNNNQNNFLYKLFLQEIELPLINTINDEMIINLCLGTPKQCFNVLVDSGSFYLWVTDLSSDLTPDAQNKFDTTKSSSFQNLKIPYSIKYGTGMAKGFISTEALTLGDLQMTNIHFILANEEEAHKGLDGILGLGYYYEDFEEMATQFSIIDQLHKNKLINKRIFSQKYTQDKKGKLYIGDLPKEISEDFDNYGNCTALTKMKNGMKNPRWECHLRAIFFGYENTSENAKTLDQRALFDTGTNLIICPLWFMRELELNYFNKLIKSNQCTIRNEQDDFFSVVCHRFANVLSLPELNFVFGDWVLKMYPQELFARYPDGSIRFIISTNLNVVDWVFGEPLLKKFHFVFDKENDVIGFYGTKDKFKSYLPFPNPYLTLIVFVIVLAVVGALSLIIYLVFKIIKRKRSQLTYYDPSMYSKFIGNENNKKENDRINF